MLDSEGVPLSVVRGASKSYNHASYGGRIDYSTNSSGNIAERYHFSAYARVTLADAQNQTIDASAIGNRFLFTGQPYFPELSAHRLGHRFYLPEQGRFTTPDAFGFLDGPNVHAYASAQPIAYIDPAGFDKASSTAHEAGRGWGRWLGQHTGNSLKDSAVTAFGGGPFGFVKKGYDLWQLHSAISQAGAQDGALGAVNVFNPAYGALTNGYEAKVAAEENRVADAVFHGLNATGKTLETVMMAVAFGRAGSGFRSSRQSAVQVEPGKCSG